MEKDVGQVLLWPSEENYPRFVAVCEGGVQPTYADFLKAAEPMLAEMLARGADITKVDPDPDDMADWCRANFGHVKSNARAAYAAFVVLREGADDAA